METSHKTKMAVIRETAREIQSLALNAQALGLFGFHAVLAMKAEYIILMAITAENQYEVDVASLPLEQ